MRPIMIIMCLAPLVLTACGGYQGYGSFTDMGAGAPNERYVVDFGPVDLGKPLRKSFTMAGLPAVEFTLGLRPLDGSAGCDAAALNTVIVKLEVQTGDAAAVVSELGPLSTWATSPSLIYKRGADHQEAKAGGAVERVRSDVHASQGWGSYFTPQISTAYQVKFEIVETQAASGCMSRLVLLGSGWK